MLPACLCLSMPSRHAKGGRTHPRCSSGCVGGVGGLPVCRAPCAAVAAATARQAHASAERSDGGGCLHRCTQHTADSLRRRGGGGGGAVGIHAGHSYPPRRPPHTLRRRRESQSPGGVHGCRKGSMQRPGGRSAPMVQTASWRLYGFCLHLLRPRQRLRRLALTSASWKWLWAAAVCGAGAAPPPPPKATVGGLHRPALEFAR